MFFNTAQALDKKKAPDFFLWGTHGKMLSLSELKNNVVLINFWSALLIAQNMIKKKEGKTTRPEELIKLNDLYNYYNNKGKQVKVVSICVDNISTSRFKKFIKRINEKFDFYVLLSNGGMVERDYEGIPVVPTTFIIDKKGFIRYKYSGENDMNIYKKAIDDLLNEKR